MIKSAYIHIPFCKNICSYCDFCKNYYTEDIANRYLEFLKKEINDKYKGENLNTLYIGGGTPSCLSLKNLEKLFSIINIFNLSCNYEFTFECNYDDITEELLKLLKKGKVNRISIGIQTFNDKSESFLGRKINKEFMIDKVLLAKKYFENINLDLMYGFGNQTLEELRSDIKLFTSLDVSHISTYCLIVEPHTKLYINSVKELDDDIQKDMYLLICDELKKAGYDHYEISNFSKAKYESKHNLTYWSNEEYYGFGLGASGFINKIRYDNTRSINKYLNGDTLIYSEKINNEQMIKDEVMLNLRKANGINKKEFKNKYKKEFKELFDIGSLIKNKFLIEDENNVFISESMFFVSNEIIIKTLDTYET